MELEPIYLNQKSFYNKAKVLNDNGVIKLQSYSTIVAEIRNRKLYINGFYSNTTLKHIREFIKQYGFETGTKAELEKMYC
ncbi:MAG: hypothetical protein HFJ25_01405 [Clostridia bacterium]|nr:hypothetical protein [Clostridia bacterium]